MLGSILRGRDLGVGDKSLVCVYVSACVSVFFKSGLLFILLLWVSSSGGF